MSLPVWVFVAAAAPADAVVCSVRFPVHSPASVAYQVLSVGLDLLDSQGQGAVLQLGHGQSHFPQFLFLQKFFWTSVH